MPHSLNKHAGLTKLLQDSGYGDFVISSVQLFKIGCVAFAESLIQENSEFPISERERFLEKKKLDDWPPKNVTDQVRTALEKHPNVFDVRVLGEKHREFIWGGQLGFLVTGPLLSTRIHLPKNQQKYEEFGEPEEHFRVLLGGSLFAAWCEIDDIPVFSSIAHEFREIVEEQVPKLTSLKYFAVGPCPIHPDFILVFGKLRGSAESDSAGSHKCFTKDGNVFLLFDDSVEVERAVLELFLGIRSEVTDFYRVSISRLEVLEYEEEAYNHFSELSDSFKAMTSSPAWKVFIKFKHSKVARAKLATLHTHLVGFENSILSCERERNRMLDDVSRNNTLSGLKGYFAEQLDPETRIPTALPQALNFFEGELQLSGNIRSLLAASLIGAVVGSALTGLFSLFLNSH